MNKTKIVSMSLAVLVLAGMMSASVPGATYAKEKLTVTQRQAIVTQRQEKGLANRAAALQKRINRDITILTNRDARLKTRIDAKKNAGYDVTAAQNGLTEYEKQLTALKALTVPTAPTSKDQVTTVRTSLLNILKAARAAVRTVNTSLADTKKA